MSKLRDKIIAAVAQAWRDPKNQAKEMDSDLAYVIVDNVERLIRSLPRLVARPLSPRSDSCKHSSSDSVINHKGD